MYVVQSREPLLGESSFDISCNQLSLFSCISAIWMHTDLFCNMGAYRPVHSEAFDMAQR